MPNAVSNSARRRTRSERLEARMTAEHLAGVEKAAALVTSVFLHGTQNRAGPAPRQGQDQG